MVNSALGIDLEGKTQSCSKTYSPPEELGCEVHPPETEIPKLGCQSQDP